METWKWTRGPCYISNRIFWNQRKVLMNNANWKLLKFWCEVSLYMVLYIRVCICWCVISCTFHTILLSFSFLVQHPDVYIQVCIVSTFSTVCHTIGLVIRFYLSTDKHGKQIESSPIIHNISFGVHFDEIHHRFL